MRHATREPRDGVEAAHDQLAARPKLLHHGGRSILRARQRLHPGELREGRGAAIAVGHQPSDGLRELGRHDPVPQTPSRHGIGLREAVENDRALQHAGQRGDADVLALVEHSAIDLVGEHDQIGMLATRRGDQLQIAPREHAPGGIVR